MTKRGKGKAGFAHIQDLSGQIQIYVRQDAIGEEQYELFNITDLGILSGFLGKFLKQKLANFLLKQQDFDILNKITSSIT